MNNSQLGKLIRQFRNEKKISAKQLCNGLCEEPTLYAYEQGNRLPDTLFICHILQRLGIEADEFAFMVDEYEYTYHKWKENALNAIEDANWSALKSLLNKKEIALQGEFNETLQKQYYLYLKGIFTAEKEKNLPSAVRYLKCAAKQTIPNFTSLEWENILLGERELHILILYLYYGVKGNIINLEEAQSLFENLESYILDKNLEDEKRAKLYSKLVCVWLNVAKEHISLAEQELLCEKVINLLRETKWLNDIMEILRLYVEVLEKRKDEKVAFYRKHYEVFEDIFKGQNVSIKFRPEMLMGRREKLFLISECLGMARKGKGMTQEQVSWDICATETYSRIETGKRAPSVRNMYALAERLGISWCYCRWELECDSLKVYHLWKKQKSATNKRHWEESLYLLKKLAQLIDMETPINKQYIHAKRNKAEVKLGKITEQEAYERDKKILGMTTGLHKEQWYYSQTELEIIGHMGEMLCLQKKYEEGIQLLETVLRNQYKSKVDFRYHWNGISSIIYVLSVLYFRKGYYMESIKIGEYIMNIDIKNNDACTLAETLDAIADNLEHMGEQYSEEYKKLYRQSFYVADFYKYDVVKSVAKRYYEENFDSNMIWYYFFSTFE